MHDAQRPRVDFSRAMIALLSASLIAALAVTTGLWAGFIWGFFPLIWLVVLVMGTIVGVPLFLIAKALGWQNGWVAGIAGALVGGLLPATLLSTPSADPVRTWAAIAAFGGCGAASGVIFLAILRWPDLPPSRRIALLGSAIALDTASFGAAWIAQDHSCHNPVWYGRGIAPSASFQLKIAARYWPQVAGEIERFAKANQWHIRLAAAFAPGRPWFETSVCRADGTDIVVVRYDNEPFEAFVYQPQGGDSWKVPMRALHDAVRTRWPNAIDYRDALGNPTAQTPEWLRKTPNPAPSSAAR